MATYNGEKYIKEQIDSILKNMSDSDELIISDDGSKDSTLEIISEYNDKRIKVIEGPHKGVKQNFANAIENANGQYIFLSDQDDIWMKNKIELILKEFENNEASVVIHDAEVIDENLKVTIPSFFEYRNSGKGILKNIYKNTYIGCCMAFKSEIKEFILPIPNNIEMHDQWIGILGESKGKGSIFLNEKLIQYRRHSNNVSQMKHYGIIKMIKNRVNFIINYLKRRQERRKQMIYVLIGLLFILCLIDLWRNKKLLSPSFIFNFIWFVTLLLYQFKLSYIQQDLSNRTILIFFVCVLSYNIALLICNTITAKLKNKEADNKVPKKIPKFLNNLFNPPFQIVTTLGPTPGT